MKRATYTPQAIAGELDVSPATLRRWSQRFSAYLSQVAGGSDQGKTHRRYAETDLTTLRLVKELMNQGLTYEQVEQQLANPAGGTFESPLNAPDGHFSEDDLGDQPEKGLVLANANESAAVAFLTSTLAALSESQKSILNSQAANRELMGVLIQDNFNLKEENNRLRERILEVERSLAQVRQDTEWQREALRQELDSKIGTVQQTANQAVAAAQSIQTPDIKAVKSKPGCLGALFGGGDVQIISMPRRREQRADGRPVEPAPASYPVPPSQPARPAHPKPTLPPE
jgi:DNA-binding transcriptional MerR regulator